MSAVASPDLAAVQAAEELWWVMHHSDDPDRKALAVTCYLDESGTGDESRYIVIGGPLFNRDQFYGLSKEWGPLLDYHRVEPPLHMQDFVRPHGRYCAMYLEMKIALFRAVVSLINRHKIYSLHVAIDKAAFTSHVARDVQKSLVGPYAAAFLVLAMRNCLVARRRVYQKRIAYLADEQNRTWVDQVHDARRLIRKWEERSGYSVNMGAVAFDDDAEVPALQAADVVAWSARRVLEYGSLENEFSPLSGVLNACVQRSDIDPGGHIPYIVPDEAIGLVAEQIDRWLASKGDLPPSLADLLQ